MWPGKYFRRYEFGCRCGCGAGTVDAELLAVLEDLRAHFGGLVTVESGHRCPAHNAMVGGSVDSYHLRGMAADVRVQDGDGIAVPPGVVAAYLEGKYPHTYGIGRYREKRIVHVDVRLVMARWVK